MLHAYELGLRADDRQRANVADLQVALMAAGWGELDVATPLFGRVVAEAAELALEQGPGDAAERWDALARAARLDAAMSVPPIVPGVDDLRLYRNLLRDDLAAMGRPEAWGKPLSQAAQRDLVGHVGRTLFHLAHQCENEVLEMRLLGAALRAAAPEVLAVDAVASEAADSVETVHDSIRIGFVSTYLTEHSIGKMLGEVLGLLSNHALIEECFAFHVVANVGDYDGRDHVRNFIDASTKAVEVARHDLVGQRMAILGAKLDVLVFPDVGMEASTYFLAFARLARVQCVWWGHPTTTGLETVDYYLSLDTEVSDADSMYDEQLVRLEHVNTAPFVEADLWRDSSPKHISDFLPLEDDARLYVVLGRLFKLHPLFDDILVDLLSRDTEGVVVLIGEPQRALNSRLWSRVSGAVKRAVADADLKDSVLRRIVFVDYWNYLHVLANAAVVLDTFPYGGCLTALDSLSNGVPLITLPSQFERGRFAMSIYQQMNFTQLVARDEAHFVELAVTVANDSRLREETVQRLRRHYPAAHRPQSVADEWAPLFHKLARHT
ncbi:hypothetical protein M885DRAFT_113548 [Pelagophyceae sp. CCMP2097]|nr:hypothetical protein M885DRAFT_113548 [Pelagophyceae sp. CCMP2097]